MQKVIVFVGVILLLATSTSGAFAHHRSRVLGISTAENVQLPPTVEGPGFLLPDNPLYFLDTIKQTMRVTLAFFPEEKAKVYADIAGERMAEARFMLAKNNATLAARAIWSMSENLQNSAKELDKAQFSGKDVSEVAKTINETIKREQEALDILEASAQGALKTQAEVSQDELFDAKTIVEDALPKAELDNEIRADLARQSNRSVVNASQSAKRLESDLNNLSKEASEAAKNTQKKREEALRMLIKEKNESLKREKINELEMERKKQEEQFKLQQQEVEKARAIIQSAQRAAEQFRKAKEASATNSGNR